MEGAEQTFIDACNSTCLVSRTSVAQQPSWPAMCGRKKRKRKFYLFLFLQVSSCCCEKIKRAKRLPNVCTRRSLRTQKHSAGSIERIVTAAEAAATPSLFRPPPLFPAPQSQTHRHIYSGSESLSLSMSDCLSTRDRHDKPLRQYDHTGRSSSSFDYK